VICWPRGTATWSTIDTKLEGVLLQEAAWQRLQTVLTARGCRSLQLAAYANKNIKDAAEVHSKLMACLGRLITEGSTTLL
jgi:hypothetical protein